jgi:hypothetical protein
MGNLPSPVAALELSPFLLWCFVWNIYEKQIK